MHLEGGQYRLVLVQKWLQRKRRVRLPDRQLTIGFAQLASLPATHLNRIPSGEVRSPPHEVY
jgi:hypothetical protein